MAQRMIAFMAIKRHTWPRRGADVAYLPNSEISLPKGWEWCKGNGKDVDTRDITDISQGMSLEDKCRMFSEHTGIEF